MRATLLLLAATLSACHPRDRGASADAGNAAEAAVIAKVDAGKAGAPQAYTAMCAVCHGPEAKGYAADHAPSLVSSSFLESATNEFLFQSIAGGRPGTPMAAYGEAAHGPLSDEQISEIVLWLRAQGPAAGPLAEPGPGDAKRGATSYATRCQGCHGDTKVRGEGVSLGNPRFVAHASRAFVRHAIVHGRAGTKMEAWKDRLSAQEIDDLVAYVFDGLAAQASAGDAGEAQLAAPRGTEPLVLNPGGRPPSFTPRSDPCPPALPDAGAKPCQPNRRYVSAEQVAKALAEKRRIILIDARPASEWMRVHAAGAVSIPHHDPKRLAEIKNDGTWVIAYCACPHHLSGDIVDMLRAKGIKNSAILDEGILEWHRRGYPVVAAPGVSAPPRQPTP